MLTTIVTKDKKHTFKIITEQYEVGLYIAMYFDDKSMPNQGASQLSEEEYHKKMRKKAEKLGDTWS